MRLQRDSGPHGSLKIPPDEDAHGEGVIMRNGEHPRSGDETAQLLAVIRWCISHELEPQEVIEGRHPHVFHDPTFPVVAPRVEHRPESA